MNYDVFSNQSGTPVYLNTVTSSAATVPYNWPLPGGVNRIIIVPWIEGSRINGTNFEGTFNFAVAAPSTGQPSGRRGVSVNLPPFIGSFDKKEVEEEAPVEEDVVAPPVEKPIIAPPVAKPPVLEEPVPVEEKLALPQWLFPLLLLILIIVIVTVIIAYQQYLKKAKPGRNSGK